MNSFEQNFFKKYIPEDQEIVDIIHSHPLVILWRLLTWIFLGVLIPTFLYYYSLRIREFIPFLFLEMFLYMIYIKIIYDIFDWYNDVWIITDEWVVELNWKLFKTKSQSVAFQNIEWIEVDQSWMDKILYKWNLTIHKIWDESFVLQDAVSPYKWLNKIEEEKNKKEEEEDFQQDKFDIIMDALGWVVENYLDKNVRKTKIKMEQDEYIEQYQNDDKTIDLR